MQPSRNTVAGTAYRIRVVSSLPAVNGTDNGSDLTINLLPGATISSFADDFCEGSFMPLVANTGTGLTYQWKLNGNPLPGATSSVYNASLAGSYTVVVTNANGCSKESIHTNLTMIIPPPGYINFAGPHVLCTNGGGTTILGEPTTGGIWIFNGEVIPGATVSTLHVTDPGSYQWIPVTLNANCIGDTSPVVIIPLVSPPAITINGLASSYSVTDAPVTLSATPPGGTFFGPGITGNTFDPAAAGVGGPYTISYFYFSFDPDSCSGSGTQQVTVVQGCIPPAATITASGATDICDGASVDLNANTGTGLTYQWKLDGNDIGGAASSSVTAIVGGSYTCLVTDANNCSAISNAIVVTVIPPTQGEIFVTGPTALCPGQQIFTLLSGNTSNGFWLQDGIIMPNPGSTLQVPGVGDYQWVPIGLLTGCIGIPSPAVTITIATLPAVSIIGLANSYSVTDAPVTLSATPPGGTFFGPGITGNTFDPAAAGAGGPYTITYFYSPNDPDSCSNSTTQQVTVTQSCTSPLAVITPAGPTTFCPGGSVLLNANTGAGLGYQWLSGPAGLGVFTNITGAINSSFLAAPLVSTDYRVKVFNGACFTVSDPITITVNPVPIVSFSGLAGVYVVNAGPATLVGVPAGGTFSGPGISGNTFDPAVAGVGGPDTIRYSFTTAEGCSNTTFQVTNVNPVGCTVPAPGSISTTGGATLVCPGDIKTYMINPVPGATSYNWIAPPGADVTGGQGTPNVTITYNAGFTQGDSLRVTASNSCGTSTPCALKINRKPAPASPVAITGPVIGVCDITAIPYAVAAQAGLTYNWSWNTGGVSIASGQGTSNVTCDFTSLFITGKISVTASNSCGTSTPRNLIVNAKPGAPGTITGSTAVCAGQQNVAYSIAPVTNATSYIWYAPTGAHISDGVNTSTGSNLVTTATSVQVNYSSTAGYVRVKGINACAAGSTGLLQVAIVCREEIPSATIAAGHNSNLYPNPSNGNFRLLVSNKIQKATNVQVDIMNQFGQTVYHTNTTTGNGTIELKLAGKLANGIYMVSYVVNGERQVRKLLINN